MKIELRPHATVIHSDNLKKKFYSWKVNLNFISYGKPWFFGCSTIADPFSHPAFNARKTMTYTEMDSAKTRLELIVLGIHLDITLHRAKPRRYPSQLLMMLLDWSDPFLGAMRFPLLYKSDESDCSMMDHRVVLPLFSVDQFVHNDNVRRPQVVCCHDRQNPI